MPAADRGSHAPAGGKFITKDNAATYQSWDTKAWMRTKNDSIGTEEVLCMTFGAGNVYAARWSKAEKKPKPIELWGRTLDDAGYLAYVHFTEDATVKNLKEWMSSTGEEVRTKGMLPKGVLVENGQNAKAIVSVKSPWELLGLEAEDSAVQTMTAANCKMNKEDGGDCSVVINKLDQNLGHYAALKVRFGIDAQTFELSPQALAAMLLIEVRHQCTEANLLPGCAEPFTPRAFALAVPSWWCDGRRSATAKACHTAGLPLLRLQSRALCIAAGTPAIADTIPYAVCRVLFVEITRESIDAAILEGTWVPFSLRDWTKMERWEMKAAAGGMCTQASSVEEWFEAAVRQVIAEGLRFNENLEAILFAGEAKTQKYKDIVARACQTPLARMLPEKPMMFESEVEAPTTGLAFIMAAESKTGVFDGLHVLDVCSEPMCCRITGQADDSNIDTIVPQGSRPPVKIERSYRRATSETLKIEDLDIAVYQRHRAPFAGEDCWRPCLHLKDVLIGKDEDGQPVPVEGATVVFEMDRSCILTAYVKDRWGFPPPKSAKTRQGFWMVCLFLLLLVFGGLFGHYLHAQIRREDYRLRLYHYMQQHNPAKLPELDSWLNRHKGTEHRLFASLEKKYNAKFPTSLELPSVTEHTQGDVHFGDL
eukprot:TRINITY_DN32893_c0_g1_i1.p1 TRINITY_DN32893_c0_g1~~TRINITY_DN32893_c0_g1_i1.p1  ORF type:complete len:650 (+),score=143.04 TRINITY_DN32893_c0_g1_i1:127-2076(+)